MNETYYLASLKRQGWFSRTAQFTSDVSDAKVFNREDALDMCRRSKAASHILIPVRASDMGAI